MFQRNGFVIILSAVFCFGFIFGIALPCVADEAVAEEIGPLTENSIPTVPALPVPAPAAPAAPAEVSNPPSVSLPSPSTSPSSNGIVNSVPAPLSKSTAENLFKAIMPVPKILDTASGNFSINDKSCELKFAYSAEILDPIQEKKPQYQILLTAEPILARVFGQSDRLMSVAPSNQCWLYAEIESRSSLNPLKFFLPGNEIVIFAEVRQPALKRAIDIRQDVIAGTLWFKNPLEVKSSKISGMISFRSQFRMLGKSPQMILQSSRYMAKPPPDLEKAFQQFLVSLKATARREVASTNPEIGENRIFDPSLLPANLHLTHSFVNAKEGKATLVIEGNYTKEQVTAGKVILKLDPKRENNLTIYNLVQLTMKEGLWVKERDVWKNELPDWAAAPLKASK